MDPIPSHTHHLVCSEVDVPRENEKVTTEESELGVRLKLSATRDSIPMDHLIRHLGRDGTDLSLCVTGKAEHKVEMVTENLFCHLAVIGVPGTLTTPCAQRMEFLA